MSEKATGARGIVKRHALYSGLGGLIPVPIIDLAAITGIQLKMLKDLASHYDVPFKKNVGKSLLSALVGGYVPTRLAVGSLGSSIKTIPAVGQFVGMVTLPAFASASTFAVGKVFIQHFDSGGTFLDFNPDAVRQHYVEEVDKTKSETAAT